MLRILIILTFLTSCKSITAPLEFTYKEVRTENFNIATWQKITDPRQPYKVYIEGDGYAFNSRGKPTNNPTPRSILIRELAFGDKNANVIYLARPCQYVKSTICSQRHWTTARFAPEIINAEYEVIKNIVGDYPVILIGFSGGAQISGLISTAKKGLNVKKIITIAGNLNHLSWTQYHNLPTLSESMNLESYKKQYEKIPQIHYVGTRDKTVPPHLVKDFVNDNSAVIEVNGATHNDGWANIYPQIRSEK